MGQPGQAKPAMAKHGNFIFIRRRATISAAFSRIAKVSKKDIGLGNHILIDRFERVFHKRSGLLPVAMMRHLIITADNLARHIDRHDVSPR